MLRDRMWIELLLSVSEGVMDVMRFVDLPTFAPGVLCTFRSIDIGTVVQKKIQEINEPTIWRKCKEKQGRKKKEISSMHKKEYSIVSTYILS